MMVTDSDYKIEPYIIDNLIKSLYEDVVLVKFTKKDGTIREMYCTLLEDHLPEKEKEVIVESEYTVWQPTDKLNKAQDPWKASPEEPPKPKESIAVWDLEKNAWRSFRFDSIIGFNVGVKYET